jgi:hypothetical protein
MMLNKRELDLNLFVKACLIVNEKKHLSLEGQVLLKNIASQFSSKLNLENKIKVLNFERSMGRIAPLNVLLDLCMLKVIFILPLYTQN